MRARDVELLAREHTGPTLQPQACEQRRSICATPFGRGPDGWYLDEAEVDFWEVWRDVA